MGSQIYTVSVTMADGSTIYTKFVQMTDAQAAALQQYLAICVANGYGCSAASVVAQESPIGFASFVSTIITNYAVAGINAPALLL
jgi:hypothetical protein